MHDRIQEQAAEAAQQVLQNFRESYTQWTDDKVPLNELAAWLGLEIATFNSDDYPKGTFGFLDPGADFDDPCKEQDVREGVTDLVFQDQAEELLGIGISYDPRSQREIAAN